MLCNWCGSFRSEVKIVFGVISPCVVYMIHPLFSLFLPHPVFSQIYRFFSFSGIIICCPKQNLELWQLAKTVCAPWYCRNVIHGSWNSLPDRAPGICGGVGKDSHGVTILNKRGKVILLVAWGIWVIYSSLLMVPVLRKEGSDYMKFLLHNR